MITITYHVGEVSLSSAIAAGKQLIMHRPAGTECTIHQESREMVITTRLIVDKNGAIEETVSAAQQKADAFPRRVVDNKYIGQLSEEGDLYPPYMEVRNGVYGYKQTPSK